MSGYLKGFLITLFGVLVLSPDTLLVRLTDAGHWTQLFWRGLLAGIAILGGFVLLSRRNLGASLARMGRADLVVLCIYGPSNLLFVYSTTHTLVANTLFIIATSPVFAALIARFVLGETVSLRTWATIAATLTGIAIIAAGSAGGGQGQLSGDLAALGVAIALAVNFSAARSAPGRSIVPAMGVSTLGIALVAALLAPTLAVPRDDWIWVALMGAIVVPLAFACIATGPRFLPAADVGLLMLLEAIFGPLLVWWVLDEVPGPWTFAGGALVLGALGVSNALLLMRRR